MLTHSIGHHNAYEAGVLHRDVSIGNIIIVRDRVADTTTSKGNAPGEDPRGSRGALIDFDNAIFYKIHSHIKSDPLTVSTAISRGCRSG